MSRIIPLPESEAADKTAQTYSRIRELLGGGEIPAPFLLMGRVEPFVGDFYMNFKKFVFSEGKLDPLTRARIALAVSLRDNSEPWVEYFAARCESLGGKPSQTAEIAAIVATNAMYNTFFKFRDLSGSELFSGMSVGLRAHTLAGTSLDEQAAELISLAISDLNACKPCTAGHVEKLRRMGVADEAILEAIQCTAAVAAGVQYLKSAGA